MVNPMLKKTEESFLTVSDPAKKLFQAIYREQKDKDKPDDETPKISVSELISKMSFYYEKIRNTVDYKEEHLLRKNAIERILRRQILIEGTFKVSDLNSEEISRHLLTELIRAAYLPNNTIPETKIQEIGLVVQKYLNLKNYIIKRKNLNYNEKNNLGNWVLSLAASDIEGKLERNKVDKVIVDYMYDILTENIILPEKSPYQEDNEIQIYIGIYRNFMKFDQEMISFLLFKFFNSNWQNASEEDIQKIALHIEKIQEEIEKQIKHPLFKQYNRIISRYNVFFSILKDVISDDPQGVYESFKKDPKAFARKIKQKCTSRYKEAKKKLWRAAIRSILYIFITKSALAVLLEVPATKFFGQELDFLALGINVSFPAILLFVIVLFTKMPGEDNSKKIVDGVEEVIFNEKKRNEPFRLRMPVKRRGGLNFIFTILYTATFFVSFGAIIWVLNKMNFNFVSILIFLFFLAFVSFFSIRIRKNSKELLVVTPRENIFSLLSDFFYVPIVLVGKWLSEKFSRVNVFVFILDFIIEAPFKVLVEVTEEWTKYVRERKDDIT